jgi:hypothetical protein
LEAIATIMGASIAGCGEKESTNPTTNPTMTEEEAKETFDSIVEFEPPIDGHFDDVQAKRFVDDEAGVVLWAVEGQRFRGGGIGVSAMPISETDLEP